MTQPTVPARPAGGAEHFDIRGPLPEPGSTLLLEASAGTGKTWTIAALVARFVAEGVVPLDRMLVVTFGRAASEELRERVRARLVAVERALGGRAEPERDALVDLLLDASADERAERLRRVREALVDVDAATIATTHQFCQQVLRNLGVAGDTDPGARLVEDLDDLLVEVVDDLYVRGFRSGDEPPAFTRAEALTLARRAVGDPQATLGPPHAEPGSTAARRYGFARAVRAEMDLRKRRLGVLSYDDLLQRLADVLGGDDAAARDRMRERWQVVLVDEFQDTDPVQWQVIERAFVGVARTVLIGDPKQAIYAFRGGDVDTYLQAAERSTGHATLGTNHRSDAPLLASVQAVLGGAALGDPRITVRDVVASHPTARLVGAPVESPFRLRLVGRGRFGPRGRRGVPIGVLRDLVSADLAGDVAALLASGATFDDEPLRAEQVAVLCRSRRQCEAAAAGLAAAGVPAVVAGSGSVFATEAADAWLCLLEAMEQPHRSARVRAAALTPFLGHRVEDLDGQGDRLTEVLADTVRAWAELARRRGVGAVLESASAAHALPARVLAHTDGERLLTDLRHVGEALHDTATRDGLGLAALVSWLREQRAEARSDVAGERTRRLDSDAAAVQILTVHGSKGLQFPVVYLPFAADLFPQRAAFPLFHRDGRRCLDVGGAPEKAVSEAAAAEEAGEELRLLYVAMTRAQSQLVSWWLPSAKNTDRSPLHRMLVGRGPGGAEVPASVPVPGEEEMAALAARWQAAGGPRVEQVDDRPPVEVPRPGPSVEPRARRWTRHVDPHWRRTSYSALSAAAEAVSVAASADPADGVGTLLLGSEPEDPPRADEPLGETPLDTPAGPATPADAGLALRSPMAGLPVGATFGSLVHAVLEHVDPAAPEHGGDLTAALRAQVAEQRVRWPVEGLDEDDLAAALRLACDTPLGPLLEERTLASIEARDRMCELDFELPLGGGDRPRDGAAARLSDLAPVLRRHLPADDPLAPYAEVLADDGHAAQVLHGYLTGSVDVVLRVGGRFVVVDYKTNWLGEPGADLTAGHYRPAALDEAMRHSSYPLQALLYAVVLHRFLRWRLPGYDPDRHLGGVAYLYLRGLCGPRTPRVGSRPCGVFGWQPPVALVEAVSAVLDGGSR